MGQREAPRLLGSDPAGLRPAGRPGAANLRRFWQQVSPQLQSRPRNSAERVELEALLRADDRAVLEALRWETEALQLRVRIVAEAVRAARQTEIPA